MRAQHYEFICKTKEQDRNKLSQPEYSSATYAARSSQPLKYTLPVLSEIREEVVSTWVTHFRDLASLTGWTPELGLKYLKSALDSALWRLNDERKLMIPL